MIRKVLLVLFVVSGVLFISGCKSKCEKTCDSLGMSMFPPKTDGIANMAARAEMRDRWIDNCVEETCE